MKIITLPVSLKPQMEFPLARIGSARDGGYLVDERLLGCDLLSFGISGDWKFEKDWLACTESGVRVVAYDGSIGSLKFIGTAIASSFRFHKPSLIRRNWLTAVDYHRFLTAKTSFHQKFVTRSFRDHNHETFARAMQNPELRHPIFLKMDIEGAEYELLDLVVQSQQEICGLAIEFHQPLHNIEAIGYFAKQLNLNITNVHVNNCLPKRDHHNTEPCIEISFSCHKGIEKPEGLPHPLERDNDPTCSPIAIRWN